jgi:hypothetical protein
MTKMSVRTVLTRLGEHHYRDSGHFATEENEQHLRDRKKKNACEKACVSLACVPYWWDKKGESLQELIKEAVEYFLEPTGQYGIHQCDLELTQ